MFGFLFFLAVILLVMEQIVVTIYTKGKDSNSAIGLMFIFFILAVGFFSANLYSTTGRARVDGHFALKAEYRVMAIDETHPKLVNLILVDEDGTTYLYALPKENFAKEPKAGDRIVKFNVNDKILVVK